MMLLGLLGMNSLFASLSQRPFMMSWGHTIGSALLAAALSASRKAVTSRYSCGEKWRNGACSR